IALQQVNILRDIREDLLDGRVYLPKDELDRHGVTLSIGADGALADPNGGLVRLIYELADRASEGFAEVLPLPPVLGRPSAACNAAMAGIYRDLLRRIQADPRAVLPTRLSLTTSEKARVALRALVRGSA